MAAIITTAIPAQPFEVIRDQIASILLVEHVKQYQLNNTLPQIKRVWAERWLPFNAETEVPTINVSLKEIVYMDKNAKSKTGIYTYFVDVYTTANTTDTENADQAAMIKMKRLMGINSVILDSPEYRTLGFAAGLIGNTSVDKIYIGDTAKMKDALSNVVGRLEFTVKAVEQNIIVATPVP